MRVLIGEIAAGTYLVGDMLPRESDLAEQFEVSRGVARECLRGLEERRMVKVRHGRGAMVTPEDDWDRFDPEVLEALLRGSRAAAVLGEYAECRRILEVEAAGLAAERATPESLDSLASAFSQMRLRAQRARENAAAEDLYREADVSFHRAVVRAAGNPMLGRMTEPIHRALAATFGAHARPRVRLERGLPEHERVLDAITARDPEAAREAMRAHLLTVEGYLREYAHLRDEAPSLN
ncbi:MAG: GntR family transcriptional regulator, transcriptional repressor for pyruvate dehydrogenase complex [Thermoleophilaceae bacterium]|jgi:GntR family transcriptional repressor for pyruvate dehydrogenase complex|nr:GntR family transcriptional regulator, transcriptional repressor for pyruvate dehydrogenase complex [Thermoleophilaceae bacterium]